jgi:hypothetical protein
MTNARKTWETPDLEVFGSMGEMTRMPTPPGCDQTLPPPPGGGCSGHKGFVNVNTPDGSDAELSHASDGFPGVS